MSKHGSFTMQDASFTIGVNVKVTNRNKKTGRVLDERIGHNTCLKNQLVGLVKWLNGEFNETANYQQCSDWIPRYLGVGTNESTYMSDNGVKTEVNINDTRLLNEISPRMLLPERNKIVNRSTQRYVQLVINAYLPSEYYNDRDIAEAGLFSRETGSNCLFRITFDPIHKTEDSVVEVTWVISVISIESNNQPYEEVDKADLRQSMERLLDKFKEKYPNLTKACDDFKTQGIPVLMKQDTTQEIVDETTKLLEDDLSSL